jgi:phosphoglycerate kinase
MGVFEWPRFAEGTLAVARRSPSRRAHGRRRRRLGARAIEEAGLADRIGWVSTGGGASLELLEGRSYRAFAAIPAA